MTISDWAHKYENAPKVSLHSSKYVEGFCEMISGERPHFAKIGLRFSPSEDLQFKISIDEETKKLCEKNGWIESICFGVLDVMLVGPMTPINNFSCEISYIEMDIRRSSRLAFRFAARTAVQNFLSKEPYQRIYDWGYEE